MDESNIVTGLLGELYTRAKAQFGDAVQSFWFYDGDRCPACTTRPIGVINYKGKEALSLNAFIYRERGVLIGYLLCSLCAQRIFATSKKHQTRLHDNIEQSLIRAYRRHMNVLDA